MLHGGHVLSVLTLGNVLGETSCNTTRGGRRFVMRQVLGVVVGLSVLLGGAARAAARCGEQPGDAAAVAAIESTLTAQCRCCGPAAQYRHCVASVVRQAVRARSLSSTCKSKVKRDALVACPLATAVIPCTGCSSDAECDDHNPCTVDRCVDGMCEHGCVCVESGSALGCCGPGPLCVTTTTAITTTSTTTTRPPPSCQTDLDCNDGNPCTVDHCVNGMCEHVCVCVDATGAVSCCPGPAALCVKPCGMDASGVCGGACPASNEVCTASGTTCTCTPIPPSCGDTFPTCNGICPVGSSCTSLTGAPACQCVPEICQPGSGTFFYTCGDPVCGGHCPHPGVPACTTEQVGAACTCLGAECDPGDFCDRLLECATSDPTHGGQCPISRRRYKHNIQYLGAPDVKRLHDALLKFPLASYQYSVPGASADTHLGFIIDDVEPSPSVAPNGDTVDLYGYTTMAVAAVQEQAREIAQLKREVASLRSELTASRLQRAKGHRRRS